MLHFINRIRNAFRRERDNFYSDVTLSAGEVRSGKYKKYLGGGQKNWESRGEFQLYLLKKMGLQSGHRVLDVGCGPLRAGEHLIKYLDEGNYAGFDYNADFVQTALEVVAQNEPLSAKKPLITQVDNFDFARIPGKFDYVIAFSVLNHCDNEKKGLFFHRLPLSLSPGARVYVTHARWLDAFPIPEGPLKLVRTFHGAEEIEPGLDMQKWGWPPNESIFPVIELMLP